VPLLGDIPILGHLFRDTNINSASTRLYVFITPTILRDATFRDLILLSKGPQAEAVVDPDMPPLEPVSILLGEREAPPVLPPRPAGSNPEPDPLDERLPVRTAVEPDLPPVPMH
jgi:hypothetical protein